MNELKLIKFEDTEKNYKLMYKWCNEKFIYEWFEQKKLLYEEVVKKYQSKILNHKQKLFIIQYNNQPIGFAQIYRYDYTMFNELKKYNNIYEYDVFIGEKEFLSRGLGTKIVKEINTLIYKTYFADCIVLRPFKRNTRAIRCYQKNNFFIIHEYEGIDTIGNKETIQVLINIKDDVELRVNNG